MLFREGKVMGLETTGGTIHARVEASGDEIEAIGWTSMLGPLSEGDRVIVNTVGIDLGLGTGGTGFILCNLDGSLPTREPPGHIVKMRYTPWQMPVHAVEAPESEHHEKLKSVTSIGRMPVVACSLHSQVAGVAAGVKAAAPDAKLGYLMTDGAALPLALSRLTARLSKEGLIDVTATSGHAFGGQMEAVNVHSGLAALNHVAGCDLVVVSMGPGVVGTGTALGFTGMEQGQVLDAAASLDGRALACLRVSFGDERERHRGLSHHTITALTVAARERATVAVPKLTPGLAKALAADLLDSGICDRHDVVLERGDAALRLLEERDIPEASSMGRTMDQTPELWLAAGAAGRLAASFL